MSSNYAASIHVVEPSRLQGAQQTSRVPQQHQQSGKVQRNEVAAGGQDLPPGKAKAAKTTEEVEFVVSEISDFVQNFQRDLQFSVDTESGRTVIKVVDSKTDEVIRQIPSEETLRMARNLDSTGSLILREQA